MKVPLLKPESKTKPPLPADSQSPPTLTILPVLIIVSKKICPHEGSENSNGGGKKHTDEDIEKDSDLAHRSVSCDRLPFLRLYMDRITLELFHGRTCGLRTEVLEKGLGLQDMGRRDGHGRRSRVDAGEILFQRSGRIRGGTYQQDHGEACRHCLRAT